MYCRTSFLSPLWVSFLRNLTLATQPPWVFIGWSKMILPPIDCITMSFLQLLKNFPPCKSSHIKEYRFAPALVQLSMGHSMCNLLLTSTWCILTWSLLFFVDVLSEFPCTSSFMSMVICLCHHWCYGRRVLNLQSMCSLWTNKRFYLNGKQHISFHRLLTWPANPTSFFISFSFFKLFVIGSQGLFFLFFHHCYS